MTTVTKPNLSLPTCGVSSLGSRSPVNMVTLEQRWRSAFFGAKLGVAGVG